jgi:hypothetical protein
MHNYCKEYKICLVGTDDKLHRLYQTKEMSSTDFKKAFDDLIQIIEYYGGTAG